MDKEQLVDLINRVREMSNYQDYYSPYDCKNDSELLDEVEMVLSLLLVRLEDK